MRWLLTLLAATVVLADEPLQLKARGAHPSANCATMTGA